MRSPAQALGLGVVSLALATSLVVPAAAATGSTSASEGGVTAKTCYSSLDDIGTSFVMSQNFAPILDPYDSAAADDVTLTERCKVKSIQVQGAYTTPDAVDSQTVTFYKNNDGKPGKAINSQTVNGTDTGGGSYDIKLEPVKLKKRTYWVSVVANLDATAGGQWYWVDSTTQKGELARWQNPRNGWQYGCTTWTPVYDCLGAGPGPDLAFALTGK